MSTEASPLATAQDVVNIDSHSLVDTAFVDRDGAPLLHEYF